jgi:hypothetical protein
MAADDLEDRVIDLVQDEVRCPRRKLTLDADIMHDIEVDGIDAEIYFCDWVRSLNSV